MFIASNSAKLQLNWKDAINGLLWAALATPAMAILTSFQASQFHIDWTKEWQLAASNAATYLLITFFAGTKNQPTPKQTT